MSFCNGLHDTPHRLDRVDCAGARFEVFDASSHMPQFEEPERFNQLHVPFVVGSWEMARQA